MPFLRSSNCRAGKGSARSTPFVYKATYPESIPHPPFSLASHTSQYSPCPRSRQGQMPGNSRPPMPPRACQNYPHPPILSVRPASSFLSCGDPSRGSGLGPPLPPAPASCHPDVARVALPGLVCPLLSGTVTSSSLNGLDLSLPPLRYLHRLKSHGRK